MLWKTTANSINIRYFGRYQKEGKVIGNSILHKVVIKHYWSKGSLMGGTSKKLTQSTKKCFEIFQQIQLTVPPLLGNISKNETGESCRESHPP